MDPLSDVLSLLRPQSYRCGGFDMGGAWSVHFPAHEGIKCYALVSGTCWLALEGTPGPVRLEAGDCFLLPRGRPFHLASDLTLPPIDAATLFSHPRNGTINLCQGGGDCFGVGGHFTLAGQHADILLSILPPIVHLRSESDKAAMRWSLERMMHELREPRPGGLLVAQQLACMMLVQALRLYLAEGLRGGVGWLFALADPQMAAAITAMHDNPAHRWTLHALAGRAGMSRSIFALKFKQTVGTSPMDYLVRWRMMLAADRLTNSPDSVATTALALGYHSESAFSSAFKRVMGRSPRHYSRGRRPAASSPTAPQVAPIPELELIAG